MRVADDWAARFFRPALFTPGMREALAAAPREARFAARVLGLRRGDRVLDLCCGTGRHSLALARRGAVVVGLDRTAAYLREARRRSRGRRVPRFVRGDMRRLSYRGEFDAVINLWTSFGYFPRLSDDRRALRGIARALKPGGRLLIDLLDGDRPGRDFQPRHWHREEDGAYCLWNVELRRGPDPATITEWTVLRPGRPAAVATAFVRLYSWERLARELRRAGLRPERRWGGLDGRQWQRGSGRLVVLARKPR